MQVRAYAKINWALRVTGRRGDGYHDIETLFQTITLHDTLTIEPASQLTLECDDPSIPVDDTNLVMRAAKAIGVTAHIRLQKQIPAGGGLGGGSSDAAAVLAAFDRRDPQIALTLGSDVPFFLTGGTAYATGRGDAITPLPPVAAVPLLLLIPEARVSTATAYGSLRHFSPPLGIDAYRRDLLADPSLLVNDFEEPVFEQLPQLRALKEKLYAQAARWAAMSGSGSTIVGAFRSAAERDAAMSAFREVRTVACETL
jgi:4-diphosphocytidyl-2-C-methyl-D-erythritol kinase